MTIRIEELLCVVTVTADLNAPLVRVRSTDAFGDEASAIPSAGEEDVTAGGASLASLLGGATSGNGSARASIDDRRAWRDEAAGESRANEIADHVYRLMRRDLELMRERE